MPGFGFAVFGAANGSFLDGSEAGLTGAIARFFFDDHGTCWTDVPDGGAGFGGEALGRDDGAGLIDGALVFAVGRIPVAGDLNRAKGTNLAGEPGTAGEEGACDGMGWESAGRGGGSWSDEDMAGITTNR